MKFLHISDTHLGYRQYGLLEREQDFLEVFNEAVDIAIDENVDFIIHTGDFFHTSRPSNKTIIDSLNILNRLNDANIPIFCIPGNHDRGNSVKDKSPLEILNNFGLKLINVGVEEFNGIDIAGLKYIPKTAVRKLGRLRDALESLLENTKNSYKILMLHQEFSPYFPDSNLLLNEEIPKDFNYVGIGHYHIAEEPIKRENNSFIVHIGSTEFTAYNKSEEERKKIVAIVEISNVNTEIRYRELSKARKFIYGTLNDENLEEKLNDILINIEEILDKTEKKPIVVLKGDFRKLEQSDVLKLLNEKNLVKDNPNILYVKHSFNSFKEDIVINNTAVKSEDEIIRDTLAEYLKEDKDLYSKVFELITTFKTFEDFDLVKSYIKENPDIFEDLLK
ncbi:MAG: metallophosphoesterase [Persephonella sp.]|nr:MAG: metallophosphoesterase [Persephonella sp.]